jgi:xylulokinase
MSELPLVEPPVEPLVLGIDLGTSSIKIVAVGPTGALLGESTSAFETMSALPLQAEQNPEEWLTAASKAMRLMDGILLSAGRREWKAQVAAIGLTGQLPTLVCLSETDIIGRAVTWKDGRADEWAAARLGEGRRKDMHARTGMPIDGRYLAPMVRFHFSDRLDVIRSILSAKDYLLFVLTGLKTTEPSTAAGYGIYDLKTGRFDAALAAFWGLPASVLPNVLPANTLAGGLTRAGAKLLGLRAGIPVSTGAADSVCASYAMAGLDERAAAISFGSSAVIVGASRQLTLDPHARYLTTPHAVAGWYGREMDLLASGTGYQWLSELFGWNDGELDRSAAESKPGANGLTFTPYLAGGEQGALWNPRLFSAMLGLTLTHSRSDIARAFLEGVFFEVRRCIEVLAQQSPVESIWVSGSIVNSASSLQMLADILQRPVAAYRHKSPAALGAALLAGGLIAQARALERPAVPEITGPDGGLAASYTAVYQRYLARAAACE